MSPDDPPVPCADCGTPTPRAEMFGHGADLRCAACADVLRDRLHPVKIRRSPGRAHLHAGPPRVTTGLLGLLIVLWVAQQMPQLARHLNPLIHNVFVHTALDGSETYRLLGFWQPALWSILHVEIWHLAMNGLTLWQIGRLIEMGWGGATLLFVVLGSAMFGTTAGWLVNAAPTIGISGGLFGLIAWLIALRRHHALAIAVVSRTFLHSIAASAVLLAVLSEVGGIPISHTGHAAGFAWGFVAGLCARRAKPLPLFLLLALATLALLVVAPDLEPLGWRTSLFGRR